MPEPILELQGVDVFYGAVQALFGLELVIYPGEMVALLGGNASGKSTTLKTILGINRVRQGKIRFLGQDITHLPTPERISRGLAVVPENRRVFPKMTVRENLELGAYTHPERTESGMARALEVFPELEAMLGQMAGNLSGGQQQMLAMGRALMTSPQLVLMDEPSMGLAPRLVGAVFAIIQQVNQTGTSVLVVEQNANQSLAIAQRGYVLESGRVVLAGPASDLAQNEAMKRAYLGQA